MVQVQDIHMPPSARVAFYLNHAYRFYLGAVAALCSCCVPVEQVQDMMRKEALLAALIRPEVALAVRQGGTRNRG